jgi:hypothetical protein
MSALRGIGRAVGTGVVWGLAWAPVAVLVGVLIIDPDNSMDEMWPAIGAYPGFLSGVLFCALLALAGRGCRPNEQSVARAAVLGAAAGLLVGAFPAAIAEPSSDVSLKLAIVGSIALAAALSGVASVLASRALRRRQELGRA